MQSGRRENLIVETFEKLNYSSHRDPSFHSATVLITGNLELEQAGSSAKVHDV